MFRLLALEFAGSTAGCVVFFREIPIAGVQYKVFIRLQTSSGHISFELQAGVVAVAGTLCW